MDLFPVFLRYMSMVFADATLLEIVAYLVGVLQKPAADQDAEKKLWITTVLGASQTQLANVDTDAQKQKDALTADITALTDLSKGVGAAVVDPGEPVPVVLGG